MNRKEFLAYLKTFFVTVFFAFLSVIALLIVAQYKVYNEMLQTQAEDNAVDYYLVGVMIEKNKYLEEQSPKDYKINLKLGMLYEIKKDYKKAEKEYKKAIAKAPYYEFKPKYMLSLMYTKLGRLEDAQAVMDGIKEKPSKKLIGYKADIYEKLGDKHYNSGDYESAIEKYQKSLSYWKVIKKKKGIEYAKNSLASSYVYLAENYLNNMKPDDAVEALKKALEIIKAPILKYKLALLLMKNNPRSAYKYFEEVFKEAPQIINYESYNKFLSTMAENSDAAGDTAQAGLYRHKMKEVKEYFETNILSVNDISLENVKGEITTNNWTKKNYIYLEGRIKNTSKNDLDSLYLQIIFKDGNETIGDYSKQIIDKNSILKAGTYSPIVSIRMSEPQRNKIDSGKNITAEVYASKVEKSYKLLLKIVDIKENIQKKTKNKFLKNFGLLFEKVTSKFPAFLF